MQKGVRTTAGAHGNFGRAKLKGIHGKLGTTKSKRVEKGAN